MPSASGRYDETLLATAPATTKAQTQAGYSTDLLNTPQGTATPPLSSPQIDVERGLAYKEYNGVAQKPNPFFRFFRTRKGKITIVVLIIVVLAAIIGGAVGGSTHKHQNSDIGSISNSTGGGESSGSTSGTQSTVSQTPGVGIGMASSSSDPPQPTP